MPSAQLMQDEEIRQALNHLRIISRYLSSQSAIDQQNRQRITIDSITSGLTLTTLTSVGSVTNIAAMAGEGVRQFEVPNRNAVANCIRQRLVFS